MYKYVIKGVTQWGSPIEEVVKADCFAEATGIAVAGGIIVSQCTRTGVAHG